MGSSEPTSGGNAFPTSQDVLVGAASAAIGGAPDFGPGGRPGVEARAEFYTSQLAFTGGT